MADVKQTVEKIVGVNGNMITVEYNNRIMLKIMFLFYLSINGRRLKKMRHIPHCYSAEYARILYCKMVSCHRKLICAIRA